MARIAGVDVPGRKQVRIALRYIYGIGPALADAIIKDSGIDPFMKADELSESQMARIREVIDSKTLVEGDLRRAVQSNIKLLKDVGAYRGIRHIRRLPIKGRTHSNARTAKGRKRMAIAGKKLVTK